jgi:5'-methylthioadenosine phosphorylase
VKRQGPVPTPFGQWAPHYRVRMGEAHVLFQPRRGDVGAELAAPWINCRANIYALKESGVRQIMTWCGGAAVNVSLSVGQCIMPHDILDDTKGRESSFFKGTDLGMLRQRPVFCEEMRAAAESAFRTLGVDYWPQGVYACTQGPRLETPAEVRRLRSWGADLVGMTLAPEAFLARELELCYFPICCIASYAEGVKDQRGEELEDAVAQAEMAALRETVGRMFALAAFVSRSLLSGGDCPCSHAMDEYRKQGRIGDDWHTWLGRP